MKLRIAWDYTNNQIPPQRWWPDGTVTIYKYPEKNVIVSMINYLRIDLERDIILPESAYGEEKDT